MFLLDSFSSQLQSPKNCVPTSKPDGYPISQFPNRLGGSTQSSLIDPGHISLASTPSPRSLSAPIAPSPAIPRLDLHPLSPPPRSLTSPALLTPLTQQPVP